jgi:hypothetical protein
LIDNYRTASRETDHGTQLVAGPREVTLLPSGHDAWVVGDEPAVAVDGFGASNYKR